MAHEVTETRFYLRWTPAERVQHWVLVISFALLVITGFALKFPESWWAWPFLQTGKYDLRGLLHRLAATIYLILALYHLGYLALTRRGRAQFRALLLRWQDLRDLRRQFRYNLGRERHAPQYGHYAYWEKIEYWALIWGTVIMALTGVLLWFENISLRLFPLWVLDVATVIHYYEAILATLSILVWHFYFVIFNPETYPMNRSMLDGVVPERLMREEHARELEMLRQRSDSATEEEDEEALLVQVVDAGRLRIRKSRRMRATL